MLGADEGSQEHSIFFDAAYTMHTFCQTDHSNVIITDHIFQCIYLIPEWYLDSNCLFITKGILWQPVVFRIVLFAHIIEIDNWLRFC